MGRGALAGIPHIEGAEAIDEKLHFLGVLYAASRATADVALLKPAPPLLAHQFFHPDLAFPAFPRRPLR